MHTNLILSIMSMNLKTVKMNITIIIINIFINSMQIMQNSIKISRMSTLSSSCRSNTAGRKWSQLGEDDDDDDNSDGDEEDDYHEDGGESADGEGAYPMLKLDMWDVIVVTAPGFWKGFGARPIIYKPHLMFTT